MLNPELNNDNSVNQTNLKLQCDNFITNFPIVIDKTKNKINLDIYTCGPNSIHQTLWGNTGYDIPKDDCSIIQIQNKREIKEVLLGI